MSKLTAKQQMFVDEYLVDLNATRAAIRAGYSEKTAEFQASRLLKNVKIEKTLAIRMKARERRTAITHDKVLEDIERIKQDAMQLVPDKDGNMVMANHSAALKAAELQGRHLGMFNYKIEVGGTISITDALAQAHARVIEAEVIDVTPRLENE